MQLIVLYYLSQFLKRPVWRKKLLTCSTARTHATGSGTCYILVSQPHLTQEALTSTRMNKQQVSLMSLVMVSFTLVTDTINLFSLLGIITEIHQGVLNGLQLIFTAILKDNSDFVARHTGQDKTEAVSQLWGRLGILLQRGNVAILGNQVPALLDPQIDGIM